MKIDTKKLTHARGPGSMRQEGATNFPAPSLPHEMPLPTIKLSSGFMRYKCVECGEFQRRIKMHETQEGLVCQGCGGPLLV